MSFRFHILLLISLGCFQASPVSAVCLKFNADCDTLVLSNGKVVLVKNLSWDEKEVHFSRCDDAENKMLTAPMQQIRFIRKANKEQLDLSWQNPVEPELTPEQQALESEVSGLMTMAILSIPGLLVFGAGIVMAIIVLIRGAKLKNRIKGHPNEAQLRRKIRRAMGIARTLLFVLLLIGLIETIYLIAFLARFNHQ